MSKHIDDKWAAAYREWVDGSNLSETVRLARKDFAEAKGRMHAHSSREHIQAAQEARKRLRNALDVHTFHRLQAQESLAYDKQPAVTSIQLPIPTRTRYIGSMRRAIEAQKYQIGAIEPPLNMAYISGLSLPIISGTEEVAHLNSIKLQLPTIDEHIPTAGEYTCIFPNENRYLAVPYGYELVAIGKKGERVAVIQSGPVYRLASKVAESIPYIIRRQEMPAAIRGAASLKPDHQECIQWKSLVPPELSVQKTREETITAVHTFMRSNFLYVLDADLGDFIEEHLDELDLIMSELKMGHCYLLTRIAAIYLRALGINAAIATQEVTNDAGTQFEKSGHNELGVFDENEYMTLYDPTSGCQEVKDIPTYLIRKLKEHYAEALNEKQKRQALQTFAIAVRKLIPDQPKTLDNDGYTDFYLDWNTPYNQRKFSYYRRLFTYKNRPFINQSNPHEPLPNSVDELQAILDRLLQSGYIYLDVRVNYEFSPDFIYMVQQLGIDSIDTRHVAGYLAQLKVLSWGAINNNAIAQRTGERTLYHGQVPDTYPFPPDTIELMVMEYALFSQLIIRALTQKPARECIIQKFGFEEREIVALASLVTPLDLKRAKPCSEQLIIQTSEHHPIPVRPIADATIRRLRPEIQHFFTPRLNTRTHANEDMVIEAYDPTIHAPKFHAALTARQSQPMVVRNMPNVEARAIYLYLDLDWHKDPISPRACVQRESTYIILRELMTIARSTKQKVYVSSKFSDHYARLRPEVSPKNLRRLVEDLSTQRDIVPTIIPTNQDGELYVLASTDKKAYALESQLQRSCYRRNKVASFNSARMEVTSENML